MNIRIMAVALALSLGGCSTLSSVFGVVTGTTVTPSQAYIAANAFDAVEATASTYLALPACVTGAGAACRTQSVVNAIVPAIRIGYKARKTLIATIVGNGSAPISLYTALTSQTSTLQSLVSTYHLGGN